MSLTPTLVTDFHEATQLTTPEEGRGAKKKILAPNYSPHPSCSKACCVVFFFFTSRLDNELSNRKKSEGRAAIQ